MATGTKPELYASMDDDGHIFLSAYKLDDPLFDNNHIELAEIGSGVINKHKSSLNILSNVLEQAGIQLICE